MPMPPLRDILNDTAADATDVEYNFNTLETHVRTEMIDRTGVVAMTGPLTLAADPTNPMEAATKQYVDATMPVAIMFDWPVETLPLDMQEMWRICDGAILNVSEHTALHDRIGGTFNRPTDAFGGTQFRLPDFRRRVAVGWDALTPGFDSIGFDDALGVADVVVPIHNHPMPHTHPIDHDHGAITSDAEVQQHTHGLGDNGGIAAGAGAHSHNFGDGSQIWYNTVPPGFGGLAADVGGMRLATFSAAPDHTHSLAGQTGGRSAVHTHGVNLPNFSGSSGAVSTANTSDAGVSATNKNYPPYLVVNKIIKVL